MKISKPLLVVAGVGVTIALVSWLASKFSNFNKGTPYEGEGGLGTLGNVTNQLLGGKPQLLGDYLGGKLADLEFGDFDGTSFTFTFAATGLKGAVNSSVVDPNTGAFTYYKDRQKYILRKTEGGQKFAVAA